MSTKRIIASGITMNNNTRETGINNNDLIVGPSGAGKTRGYVIPNILRAEESMIIADTKGNLCNQYGPYLRQRGYKVMSLDFVSMESTRWGYNPLTAIRKTDKGYHEGDIKKTSAAICPVQDRTNPYWDFASQMYLECLISYVLNFLPESEHHLTAVYELLCMMDTEEFRVMMEEACESAPDSDFAKQYRIMRQNSTAEKMDSSIRGILAQHLDVLSYADSTRMFTMDRQIELKDLAERRSVIFVTVSDCDRSRDCLVNLFYTQALQFLIAYADKKSNSRLPVPVRFILDDFSTNTVIPKFDNIISVIRSREISVSLIIQSISQLEGLYGNAAAQTIINNCDNCLYLGGQDVQTAQYFSQKLNKTVATVLSLPLERLYLFTRGREPVLAEKYDLSNDLIYLTLSGEQPDNLYQEVNHHGLQQNPA